MKIKMIVFVSVLFSSCISTTVIQNTYTIQYNPIMDMQLTLNDDKSFVQYVRPTGCEHRWYFGYYKIKGNTLTLNQISANLNYLKKKSTIICNTSVIEKGKRIYVFLNEKRPYSNANVYIDGEKLLGQTNKEGEIEIPNGVTFHSLSIKNLLNATEVFELPTQKYNQIFIMIYDYTSEECANLSYVNLFKISKWGLSFPRNWDRSVNSKRESIYLFPGDTSKRINRK